MKADINNPNISVNYRMELDILLTEIASKIVP